MVTQPWEGGTRRFEVQNASQHVALLKWGVVVASMVTAPAIGQLGVASWNIAQMRGEFSAIEHVLAEASADPYPGFTTPVAVWVFQEVDTDNVADLHALLGPQYSQGTYTSSGEDTYSGAQAMFFRSDMVTEVVAGHDDIYTGAGRRTDRWQIRLLGSSPPCDFYIYSSHLKASTGTANQEDRRQGIEWILENAQELPDGSCIIYAGDYNIYSSGEPAYELLVAEGPRQAIDPYGNGTWSGDGNAYKHTQSPRADAGSGLIGGSLDDRFDFQLFTSAFQDGVGLDFIDGTLRPLGNDGNHYDVAINDGTNAYFPGNTPRSNALADALHDGSDHIPVIAVYTEPAVLSATLQPSFGPVIVGATIDLLLTIDNVVDVVVPEAGATLNWSATGTDLLASVNESGSVASAGGPSPVSLSVVVNETGTVSGQLTIDSADLGTQQVPSTMSTSGTSLRHANASLSPDNDENFRVFFFEFEADTGVHAIGCDLYNLGYDSQQALLDFDAISSPSPPFVFTGEPASGIGNVSEHLPFTFDTAGLDPGTYVENLSVSVSDQDLPGEAMDSIMVVLSIEVTDTQSCEGDFSGDGMTDIQDLLYVIQYWGSPYDVVDLLLVISDWDCQ